MIRDEVEGSNRPNVNYFINNLANMFWKTKSDIQQQRLIHV